MNASVYGRHLLAGAMAGAMVLLLVPAVVMAESAGPVVFPAAQEHPLRDAMYDVAWIGAAGALDLASTRHFMTNCPTCYEANPLIRSYSGAVAVKLAGTAAAGWGCYELRKRGHPNAARWIRWGIVALYSGAAVNNLIRAR